MEKHNFAAPFSFVNPSMIPSDIPSLTKAFQIDEYGFQQNLEESSETKGNNDTDDLIRVSELDYQELKQKWIKFLESKYRKFASDKCKDMSEFEFDLNNIDDSTRSVLSDLLEDSPISHDLRSYFWIRLSNALSFKHQQNWKFQKLLDKSRRYSERDSGLNFKQLHSLFPTNLCYETGSKIGQKRWRNCMKVIDYVIRREEPFGNREYTGTVTEEWNLPLIASHLLLLCNEEDCCWILLKLASLPVVYNCLDLVQRLIDSACPSVVKLIRDNDIDLPEVLKDWFTTMFASVIHNPHLLFSLWDIFFLEGPIFLVYFTIGLFVTQTKNLNIEYSSHEEAKERINKLPYQAFKIDNTCWWSSSRQASRQLGLIWRSGKNVCKRVRNLSPAMFNYQECPLNRFSQKLAEKHVKQTALLMRLHEAIIAIKDHFQSYDPDKEYEVDIILNENIHHSSKTINHQKNLEDLSRRRTKRAKAIMQFVPESESDLAFSVGDIIEIHEDEQEHCWLGSVGDKLGLFPPQLVEVLDEREQEYSIAGDDRTIPFLNNIIRGELSTVLKEILVNDIRRPKISLTGSFYASHPWSLIEMVSNSLDDSAEYRDLFSRLVLNRTFNLDRYMTVLKPAEMLYRSVAEINKTHSDAPLDLKFRTLICMGLNQYSLHHWFELMGRSLFCADYFDETGIVRTPVWKLVLAELKLLVQFPFHMDPYTEMKMMMKRMDPALNNTFDDMDISQEEVCDMLVTHHLFSWESR